MTTAATTFTQHTTTPEERLKRLKELEGVIARGKEVFLEVGRALDEIRKRQLYYPEHETFPAYCEATYPWWPRRTVSRYIVWARVDEILSPIGDTVENEAQARELHRLAETPEAAERVWREVGEQNGGRRTAESLRAAVDRELGLDGIEPGNKGENVHFSSDSDEWYTPSDIVGRVKSALGGEIDLDPCAEEEKKGVPAKGVPAKNYYTKDDDGLSQEWRGRVFMNPPYSEADRWVAKLVEEYEEGCTTAAVVLVPNRSDTAWHARLRAYPRCEIRGRIKFNDESGSPRHSALFASAAFYLQRYS